MAYFIPDTFPLQGLSVITEFISVEEERDLLDFFDNSEPGSALLCWPSQSP